MNIIHMSKIKKQKTKKQKSRNKKQMRKFSGGVRQIDLSVSSFFAVLLMICARGATLTLISYSSLKGFVFRLVIPTHLYSQFFTLNPQKTAFNKPVVTLILKFEILSRDEEGLSPLIVNGKSYTKVTDRIIDFHNEAKTQQNIYKDTLWPNGHPTTLSVADFSYFDIADANILLEKLHGIADPSSKVILEYLHVELVSNVSMAHYGYNVYPRQLGMIAMEEASEGFMTIAQIVQSNGNREALKFDCLYAFAENIILFVKLKLLNYDCNRSNVMGNPTDIDVNTLDRAELIDFGRILNIRQDFVTALERERVTITNGTYSVVWNILLANSGLLQNPNIDPSTYTELDTKIKELGISEVEDLTVLTVLEIDALRRLMRQEVAQQFLQALYEARNDRILKSDLFKLIYARASNNTNDLTQFDTDRSRVIAYRITDLYNTDRLETNTTIPTNIVYLADIVRFISCVDFAYNSVQFVFQGIDQPQITIPLYSIYQTPKFFQKWTDPTQGYYTTTVGNAAPTPSDWFPTPDTNSVAVDNYKNIADYIEKMTKTPQVARNNLSRVAIDTMIGDGRMVNLDKNIDEYRREISRELLTEATSNAEVQAAAKAASNTAPPAVATSSMSNDDDRMDEGGRKRKSRKRPKPKKYGASRKHH
jgi:hypothetical protein